MSCFPIILLQPLRVIWSKQVGTEQHVTHYLLPKKQIKLYIADIPKVFIFIL
jgi:hypothetical protein